MRKYIYGTERRIDLSIFEIKIISDCDSTPLM